MTLKIYECEQGSPEWFEARCGVITASRFKDVLTQPKTKKARENGESSQTRISYAMELAAERVREIPNEIFSNEFLQRGQDYEEMVLELYQERTGYEIQKIGFMREGYIGASADGLVGDDGVVEFKTRLAKYQAALLLNDDDLPKEHVAQAQGNLFVSGRKWLDYVSYCPGLPLYIQRIERDEDYHNALRAELSAFDVEVQDYTRKLIALF